MGIKNMKITPKTGAVVGSVLVADTDELVLLSSNNKIIRIKVDEVRRAGRDTQGVKLVNLEGDQKVICFDIVVQENSLQKKED
jgi:DNA gyrase subunit A